MKWVTHASVLATVLLSTLVVADDSALTNVHGISGGLSGLSLASAHELAKPTDDGFDINDVVLEDYIDGLTHDPRSEHVQSEVNNVDDRPGIGGTHRATSTCEKCCARCAAVSKTHVSSSAFCGCDCASTIVDPRTKKREEQQASAELHAGNPDATGGSPMPPPVSGRTKGAVPRGIGSPFHLGKRGSSKKSYRETRDAAQPAKRHPETAGGNGSAQPPDHSHELPPANNHSPKPKKPNDGSPQKPQDELEKRHPEPAGGNGSAQPPDHSHELPPAVNHSPKLKKPDDGSPHRPRYETNELPPADSLPPALGHGHHGGHPPKGQVDLFGKYSEIERQDGKAELPPAQNKQKHKFTAPPPNPGNPPAPKKRSNQHGQPSTKVGRSPFAEKNIESNGRPPAKLPPVKLPPGIGQPENPTNEDVHIERRDEEETELPPAVGVGVGSPGKPTSQ